MRVVKVEPGKPGYVLDIPEGLDSLQAQVGGYVEAVYPWEDEVAVICNENGKLIGLPFNRALVDEDGRVLDYLVGTFLIVGCGEEDFTDLPEDLEAKYFGMFNRYA